MTGEPVEEVERRWQQRGRYALVALACSAVFGVALLTFGYLDRAPDTALGAEDSTGRATNVLAVVAVFQTAATFIGIVLLYRTFEATRATLAEASATTEAAALTARAAMNAERAHVRFDLSAGYQGTPAIDGRATGEYSFRAMFENYGATPADSLDFAVLFDPRDDYPDLGWNLEDGAFYSVEGVMPLGFMPTRIPNRAIAGKDRTLGNASDPIEVTKGAISSETLIDGRARLLAAWRYTDVFGVLHEHCACFQLTWTALYPEDRQEWAIGYDIDGYSDNLAEANFTDEIFITRLFHRKRSVTPRTDEAEN